MRSEFGSILIAIERNESMNGEVQLAEARAVWGFFPEWRSTLLDHRKQGCTGLESGHGTPFDWLLPSFEPGPKGGNIRALVAFAFPPVHNQLRLQNSQG